MPLVAGRSKKSKLSLMRLRRRSTGSGDEAPVTGFAIDHRKVAPGRCSARSGAPDSTARTIIPEAVVAGAVAVVARPEATVEGAAHIADAEPRRAFARLAAKFFAPFPETVVAVTGTNGKTSTVELTRQLWRMAGHPRRLDRHARRHHRRRQVTTGLTTPDIVTFLSNMAGLRREGVTHVAFEASSHGLVPIPHRGAAGAAGAFTNFSRDHLDYHGTWRPISTPRCGCSSEVLEPGGGAVVWADDPKSDEVIAALRGARAAGGERRRARARRELVEREPTQLGQKLTIEAEGKSHVVTLPLIGAYQADNALTAAGLVLATGGELAATLANLGRVQPVRGRLERAVITAPARRSMSIMPTRPTRSRAAIEAFRPHAEGRLIIVWAPAATATGQAAGDGRGRGAARGPGDRHRRQSAERGPGRDPRAIMPARRARPRSAVGARRSRAAIAEAGPGDIVLLAGKGHEQGQIVGDRVLPFDDVTVARECAA